MREMESRFENAEYMLRYKKTDLLKDFFYCMILSPVVIFLFAAIFFEWLFRIFALAKDTIWFLFDINGGRNKFLGYEERNGKVVVVKELEEVKGEL